MGLSKFNKNVENIIALDDNPNEGATPLTSSELKEKFDQAGKDIKDYINNTLTSEIDNTVSNIDDSISDLNTNLTGEIGNLDNLTTTNKSNVVSAANEINAKLDDTGWENISASRGTWDKLRIRKVGKKVYFEGYASAISFNGESAQKKICTIPEGFRLPGTGNKYFIVATAGSSLAKLYLKPSEANSNPNDFGFDWIKRMSDAADDKSSRYLSFSIEYFID